MEMFLNGTAMSGQADHVHLDGAPFLGRVRTAPRYFFFAVRDEFPGLVPTDRGGASIEGELYRLDPLVWSEGLAPAEPAELTLGLIELEDGREVHAMLLDLDRVPDSERADITACGGWLDYLSSKRMAGPSPRTS